MSEYESFYFSELREGLGVEAKGLGVVGSGEGRAVAAVAAGVAGRAVAEVRRVPVGLASAAAGGLGSAGVDCVPRRFS